MTDVSGTSLTLIGMGVVFSALILLALAAWILERVFRASPEPPAPSREPIEPGKEREQGESSQVEAVIALALAYHMKNKRKIHIETARENIWIQNTRVYE
ncbi:MAG: OadG family protein [Theionarchaea archaeon]|nr:OadG family protein [Theionarchaea archaeon]